MEHTYTLPDIHRRDVCRRCADVPFTVRKTGGRSIRTTAKEDGTMKLVIAEKPSVAMSLAAVLGAIEKKEGYLEGGGFLVSWCRGHLLDLAQPEA